MNISVLFRKNLDDYGDEQFGDEFNTCSKYFQTYENRTRVPKDSLVIGRYSVLPYYPELEADLRIRGCILINNYKQHRYIADITNYYEDLKDFTPKTYTEWGNIPEGQYIVKGKTNSRKHHWNTHMFAKDKKSLIDVVRRVFDDSFISSQGVVVREYIPLKKLDEGMNDLPITNEWRFFFYRNHLLTHGYYWASCPEAFDKAECSFKMIDYAKEIATIVSKKANFFVLDIGEKAEGGFTLIEINDGQMSGLSLCEPEKIYSKFKDVLNLDYSWF